MNRNHFVTLDVFTNQRFGGNPLAVFPSAAGMETAEMQAIAREFNMSEVAFIQPPVDPANTASVRIFTSDMEIGFAGHPNVGVGWLLAGRGQDENGRLRLEQSAGLVEIDVERVNGEVVACRIGAPKPLELGQTPDTAMIAACAGLRADQIGTPVLASVGLATICVPVSAAVLAMAKCDSAAFDRIAELRPDLAQICLLYLYNRDGRTVRARMFAPLSGTIEDPATGSAACALTAQLLDAGGGDDLTLDVVQGVEMGRPSRMRCEARRMADGIRAWVAGGCVAIMRGELI